MSADSLQTWVLNLPQGKFYLYLLICIIASVVGFVFAFIFFRRARIIEDTPTSKIRSAAQGYVELAGRGELMEGEPVALWHPAPVKNCLHWWEVPVAV